MEIGLKLGRWLAAVGYAVWLLPWDVLLARGPSSSA